jgi:STAS domain
VKYTANGMNIRSTIERPPRVARWLDSNADRIQILVLQNYLFFGNASSILFYITSMFEDPPDTVDPIFVSPKPSIVILDLTLVTGMDTSAVDAFSDILVICGNHDCKLFLSGMSTSLRLTMSLSGVKPETGRDRSQRKLRFFPDLDTAIGKAEDMLIKTEEFHEDPSPSSASDRGGFLRSLSHIDDQHRINMAKGLKGLQQYSAIVDLQPGEKLYEDQILDRGLFFIEHGMMVIFY